VLEWWFSVQTKRAIPFVFSFYKYEFFQYCKYLWIIVACLTAKKADEIYDCAKEIMIFTCSFSTYLQWIGKFSSITQESRKIHEIKSSKKWIENSIFVCLSFFNMKFRRENKRRFDHEVENNIKLLKEVHIILWCKFESWRLIHFQIEIWIKDWEEKT
jgi:hypothetical protein